MEKKTISVDVTTGEVTETVTTLTAQEIVKAQEEQAYVDSQAYIAKRQAEYPPMADYLDAIVKGDTAQQQAYIDACLAVKAKYPKGVA